MMGLNGHLLGIYEKAFPAGLSWPERFGMVKELGFDFMELSIDESDDRLARLYWDAGQHREFAKALYESGITIQSICLSGHRRYPFGNADEKTREKAQDIMERAIQFANRHGIRVIQLAGYDVYYEPSTPESRRLFMDGMKLAAAFAAKHQVMLAMEIMDTEFMSSISRFMELKREIPSPWFKVYPDLGNLSAWGNDVLAELVLGRDEIVAIHVKDTLAVTESFPGKFKDVPFGAGCVDFSAAFCKLEEIGYFGPYMIELWHQKGQDARETIKDALSFVQKQYAAGCGR